MRLFIGIILGCALTIVGVYIADSMRSGAPGAARPMVNWDVVSKNFDGLADLARDGWKKIAG
jgi:hypothetical protein